jgi:hypothetical protein
MNKIEFLKSLRSATGLPLRESVYIHDALKRFMLGRDIYEVNLKGCTFSNDLTVFNFVLDKPWGEMGVNYILLCFNNEYLEWSGYLNA